MCILNDIFVADVINLSNNNIHVTVLKVHCHSTNILVAIEMPFVI